MNIARWFSYTRFLESQLERERKTHSEEAQRLKSEALRLQTETKEMREWIRGLEEKADLNSREHEYRIAHPSSATPRETAELLAARNAVGTPPTSGPRMTMAATRSLREKELRAKSEENGGPFIKTSFDLKKAESKAREEMERVKGTNGSH